MESILKQFTKPEWWFTVVVMGLLVGVAASYAKDYIPVGLSFISKRFRSYSEHNRTLREEKIELLSKTPHLLVIEYIRACISLIIFLMCMGLSYLLPAWNVLRKAYPEVDPAVAIFGIPKASDTLHSVFSLVFMVIGFFFWFKLLRRFQLCEKVRLRIIRRET